ncbi:Addiction module protein [Hyphomicrobium sp. 1Nfss2.1]
MAMNERVKRLSEEIRKLAPEEQADLMDELIVLSYRRPDPETEKAWIEEAETRVDARDRGETRPIPHDVVMEQLRKRFGPIE